MSRASGELEVDAVATVRRSVAGRRPGTRPGSPCSRISRRKRRSRFDSPPASSSSSRISAVPRRPGRRARRRADDPARRCSRSRTPLSIAARSAGDDADRGEVEDRAGHRRHRRPRWTRRSPGPTRRRVHVQRQRPLAPPPGHDELDDVVCRVVELPPRGRRSPEDAASARGAAGRRAAQLPVGWRGA